MQNALTALWAMIGALGLLGKAIVLLGGSFIGIAVFRILEDRAKKVESPGLASTLVLLCNVGKVLSVLLMLALVLHEQIAEIARLL